METGVLAQMRENIQIDSYHVVNTWQKRNNQDEE